MKLNLLEFQRGLQLGGLPGFELPWDQRIKSRCLYDLSYQPYADSAKEN